MSPLELYGDDLTVLSGGSETTTWLRYDDGYRVPLDLPRWVAPAAGADENLLARCTSPTLDIGCGPGRLTRALRARGLDCLGVDVAPVAVDLARTGGMPVLHASVYDDVLDGTLWGTVLLADGNVGIGGDAAALLRRCRELLMPDGRVLVELDPPSAATREVSVRIESGDGRTSSWFPWAHVSARDVEPLATDAGLEQHLVWQVAGRWFADLRPAAARRLA